MTNENGDKRPPIRESDLLPAMMAIALAVAAQLALQDGLTLLGAAAYFVAAWLFVSSVRTYFDRVPEQPARQSDTVAGLESDEAVDARSVSGTSWVAFLRHNWRLVTLAEIFTGDIPPARLQALELSVRPQVGPDVETEVDEAPSVPQGEAPVAGSANLQSWTASESPESAPKAVKVTPQGDVLVLDAGLEQVQRFDDAGNLLATYSVAGMAGMEVMDLAVSPDGRTLYVVDATSKQLQVITLSDESPADRLSGESEEE